MTATTVGMDWTRKAAAICCSASTSTFARIQRPPYSTANFSSTGLSCLHGPHQEAHRSTTTGTIWDIPMTSASELASVTSMITVEAVGSSLRAAACSWPAGRPPPRRDRPLRAEIGVRLCRHAANSHACRGGEPHTAARTLARGPSILRSDDARAPRIATVFIDPGATL